MSKKILAFLLASLIIFSLSFTTAYAENKAITVELNKENSLSLASGDKATFSLPLAGGYTFITTGSKNVVINKVVKNSITGSTTSTPLDIGVNGNVCDYAYYLNLTKQNINFEISTKDGKAAIFKLWVIETDPNYSGFTSQPTANVVYREDIDFTVTSNGGVNFTKEPDFKGAVFSFNNSNNVPIYQLKDDNVLSIVSTPVYNRVAGTITYTAFSAILSKNNSISFKAKPNWVASASVVSNPNADKVYHFGKDGVIKGTVFSYVFIPSVNLEGITVNVQYKDGSSQTLTVQKDSSGYYVNGTYGKISVTNEITASNQTATVNGTIYIGNCKSTLPVKIEKASFFEMISIFFGLLFGKYK